jgi:hypothetical protein
MKCDVLIAGAGPVNRCFERWGYDFLLAPVSMQHFSDHAEQLRRAFVVCRSNSAPFSNSPTSRV